MVARYIDYLEKTFVEQGGIRERMTAARLDYRGGQKAEIERLRHDNEALRNYCRQLEARIKALEGNGGIEGHEGHEGIEAFKAAEAIEGIGGTEATEALEEKTRK